MTSYTHNDIQWTIDVMNGFGLSDSHFYKREKKGMRWIINSLFCLRSNNVNKKELYPSDEYQILKVCIKKNLPQQLSVQTPSLFLKYSVEES